MRYRIPLREARGRLQAQQPFNCNDTLVGRRGRPHGYGWLFAPWVAYIRQFGDQIVYTVWSYQTPIAWVMRDGRVIAPDQRFSQTTSRHQRALGLEFTRLRVDDEVAA